MSAIVQRILAAVLGGYALATAASACVAYLLPLPRFDATMIAVLVAICLYTMAILWVFTVRSLGRMWRGLAGSTATCALLAILLLLLGEP